MISNKKMIRCFASLAILLFLGCSREPAGVAELKHYPVDSLDNLINKSGVEM
ncbi:MAG: hypothetical protein U9Q89_05225 [Thermodesulfobacteriota bacterium]|nr:hypothetical protein [Thermodesulfobacteriota bacterium]